MTFSGDLQARCRDAGGWQLNQKVLYSLENEAIRSQRVSRTESHTSNVARSESDTEPHEDHQSSRRAYRELEVRLYLSALVAKVEKKGRTVEELHQVISWLTGFKAKDLQRLIESGATFEQFFAEATLNPNARLITGSICGYRVEEIETPLTQQGRYLDKLVDELAKGRKMEKILRSP